MALVEVPGNISLARSKSKLSSKNPERPIQKPCILKRILNTSTRPQCRTIPFLKIVEFALKRDTANRKRHHRYQCY